MWNQNNFRSLKYEIIDRIGTSLDTGFLMPEIGIRHPISANQCLAFSL
jgi:hypothetical protein